MQTVYIDILFILNVYINYLLLASAGRICSIQPKVIRMVAGALLGGLYSVLLFFPQLGFLQTLLAKIILAASLIVVVFSSSNLRMYIKLLLCFLGLNFLLAGLLLLLWVFAPPDGMSYANGVAYFNISPLLLVGSTSVCYALIWLFSRIGPHKIPQSGDYRIKIIMQDKSIETQAIMDTGNSLRDNRSGNPVIVLYFSAVMPLMPFEVIQYFDQFDSINMQSLSNKYWSSRFVVIPYRCVGANGLLPAFRPDRVELKCEGKQIELGQVIIAVSKTPLSDDYSAILSPQICINKQKTSGGKLTC